MLLNLKRIILADEWTGGILYIDGKPFCFTLEDAVRLVKIAGATAIPSGDYPVMLGLSPKRKIIVPWILDVPGFDAIQIHIGNTVNDTDGCILVGCALNMWVDKLTSSRPAFEKLMKILKATKEEISISVTT